MHTPDGAQNMKKPDLAKGFSRSGNDNLNGPRAETTTERDRHGARTQAWSCSKMAEPRMQKTTRKRVALRDRELNSVMVAAGTRFYAINLQKP